jgi:hypothetical protein
MAENPFLLIFFFSFSSLSGCIISLTLSHELTVSRVEEERGKTKGKEGKKEKHAGGRGREKERKRKKRGREKSERT